MFLMNRQNSLHKTKRRKLNLKRKEQQTHKMRQKLLQLFLLLVLKLVGVDTVQQKEIKVEHLLFVLEAWIIHQRG